MKRCWQMHRQKKDRMLIRCRRRWNRRKGRTENGYLMSLTAVELGKKIKAGEVTAVEAVKAVSGADKETEKERQLLM